MGIFCSVCGQKIGSVTSTPEYKAWRQAIVRCSSPKGELAGKGIKVCQRWLDSFEAFLHDVGLRPSPAHRLSRIDRALDHQPGNTVWMTTSEISKRVASRGAKHPRAKHPRTLMIVHDGRKQSLSSWAAELGMSYSKLYIGIRAGKSLEEIGIQKRRRLRGRMSKQLFDYSGEKLNLSEISRRAGVSHGCLYYRLRQGESLQQALNQNVDRRRGRKRSNRNNG